MADSYDLNKLGSEAFENIVNFLALKTLGLGSTGFGPGADGGRDGFFEGEAPYPSDIDRWNGIWYIQSKFHKPHLSKDPQKWLIEQVAKEIEMFEKKYSNRKWPNNWIIATNIDPSGVPETGSFDAIRNMLNSVAGGVKVNLNIWGGKKILNMLMINPDVATYYGHLLTPGHVISALYNEIIEEKVSVDEMLQYFIVTQFSEHTYTKLDQAGSSTDVRPNVQDLFIDIPFSVEEIPQLHGVLRELCYSSAQCHRYSLRKIHPQSWLAWHQNSRRARVRLLKGGPGQGKSTVGQYLCQIHRAKLILEDENIRVIDSTKGVAEAVFFAADRDGYWPTAARIPIQIELKEYAHWYSQRTQSQAYTVLNYIAETVQKRVGTNVSPKFIRNALSRRSWILVFDGLDEVPNDYKDKVAKEVLHFLNEVLVEIDGDVLSICTSRPQGYSGQFSGLDGPILTLTHLNVEQAMRCATPLLMFGRSSADAENSINTLQLAIRSQSVQELMTTPLQSHIMAVVVRDGGRPPERRWQLFNSFYLVMKKRESMKNFQNPRIAKLLREEDRLLKSVHMRLGFVLHARAERSDGAQTTLNKAEFRELVTDVVKELDDLDVDETVEDVMEATTERLVLVSTPENGNEVGFDIRQLQEFFAAEFLYAGVDPSELADRVETIGGDAHWREVMHFLLSALIVNQRLPDLAIAVQTLRKLNEGDEFGDNSIYARRMAKAVLLGSRLLSEGVLEQDQRDRQRVRPLFNALGGIFDVIRLNHMVRMGELARSKQWLVQICLDVVSTANSREYIGAIYLLGWLLPEGNSNQREVESAFFLISRKCQEELFKFWAPPKRYYRPVDAVDKVIPISAWVVRSVIKILNSSDWVLYDSSLVEIFIQICFANRELFLQEAIFNGMSEDLAISIEKTLNIPEDMILDGGDDVATTVIEEYKFLANWENSLIPEHLLEVDAELYFFQTKGFFKILFSCIAFAKNRDENSLEKFTYLAEKYGPDHISVIPSYILALVPVSGAYSNLPGSVKHLKGLVKDEINAISPKGTFRSVHSDVFFRESIELTEANWVTVAENFPSIAIDLVFNYSDFSKSELKTIPESVLLLMDQCDNVASYILKWGILKDLYPAVFNNLKKTACLKGESKYAFWHRPGSDVQPFQLEMPGDEDLLCILAPAILSWWEMKVELTGGLGVDDFQNLISKFGLNKELLRNIFECDRHDKSVRSGAIALFWLTLPGRDALHEIDIEYEGKYYFELLNDFNAKWLTKALIDGILSKYSESNFPAVTLVANLLVRCKDGSEYDDQLIELLDNWRERSVAPVNTRNLMAKWLGYNFQAPNYI